MSRIKLIALAILLLAVLPILYTDVSTNHGWDDWTQSYRPAALTLLHGGSPYGSTYYNAPWTLLPLLPLALLPYPLGRFLFCVVSFAGFALIARRLTSHPISIILFLTSAPVLFCLDQGNIDWLPMLGFVLPAPFAIIFAAMKPQLGAGIVLYWLFVFWGQGGARQVIRNFLPVSLLLAASVVFYGLWPLHFSLKAVVGWNVSPFPYLLPLGVFLVARAVRRQQAAPAMAAGIFFAPYFSLLSLSALLASLLERPRVLAAAWAILWICAGLFMILK
jgi:hypothetical protein